mgnify:CR=1 FL=1
MAYGKQWQTVMEDGTVVTRSNTWSPPGSHPVGYGVKVVTKDGELVRIEGDDDNPITTGRVNAMNLALREYTYAPSRIIHPMKRNPEDRGKDKWVQTTWDEALDTICDKVRYFQNTYGPESIVCHIGTGRNNCDQIPYLCYAAFGSPNFSMGYLAGDSCFCPRSASMASQNGDFMIADCSQQFEKRYDESTGWRCPEVIVNWGCNAVVSNSDNFFGGWIVDCMQRGSKMITIDPSLTWLASRSAYWLRVRPGTDAALAMAMLNVIISEDLYDHDFVAKWCYGFDELAERVKEWTPERAEAVCWVPKDTIIGAARAYAKAKPATIHWGLPIDQAVVGIPTAQAINALWAVTGNTDVPGGNIIIRNAFEQNVSYNYGYQTLPAEVQAKRIGAEYPLMSKAGFSSTAHSDSILQAIETGKPYTIRMLWLSSTNPIANMASDAPRVYRAVRTLDFVVVSDPFLTPTAVAFADVFLPASMSCERNTQRVWWVPLRGMKKVTQFADVRSDDTIVTDLGRRLHPENFPWTDDIGWTNDILVNDTPGYDGDFEQLCKDVYVYPAFEYRKHEKGLLRPDGQPGFNTPSGRIELYNSIFALWGYDPLPQWEEPSCSPYASPELYEQYPFVLTTGARSVEFFHSEHRQLETSREFHPDPLFEMSPKAAEAAGLSEGDWCWLENHRGRCRQKLHVNPSLDDRVVRAEHGWWFPEQEAAEPVLFGVFDSNINNLLPQCENGPTGYGAPYKNQLCRVYACTEENSAELPTACVTRKDGYSK